MELPIAQWRMSALRAVKVNVSGFYSEVPLPNGNKYGIGVVIRSYRGRIYTVLAGSLGIEERRINELYAMLEGLIRAYHDDFTVVELEIDNVGAEWEWDNSLTHGVTPEHAYVVQQLNQRKNHMGINLTVRVIDEDSNAMARYLARYGAENFSQMVILDGFFGRLYELWTHDMGLGPVGDQFNHVRISEVLGGIANNEAEVENEVVVEDEEDN